MRGFDAFTELMSLDLSFNKIKHIKRVNHLTKLKDLYFVQNKISAIEGLEGLSGLRQLELGANRIREMENLETLTGLEELWLGKNKITEMKGLDTLTNLTILSLPSNRLTSVSGLSALVNLEELYISHNAITQISGLENCTNLRNIDVTGNPIEHLTGLESLEHLQEFWASSCKLDSFQEVEQQLKDKKELETVYFEGNPLQRKQMALYRNKIKLALPQIKQIDASEFHLASLSWKSISDKLQPSLKFRDRLRLLDFQILDSSFVPLNINSVLSSMEACMAYDCIGNRNVGIVAHYHFEGVAEREVRIEGVP
jgi:protein phosphatase 1 regulatory subunit 7